MKLFSIVIEHCALHEIQKRVLATHRTRFCLQAKENMNLSCLGLFETDRFRVYKYQTVLLSSFSSKVCYPSNESTLSSSFFRLQNKDTITHVVVKRRLEVQQDIQRLCKYEHRFVRRSSSRFRLHFLMISEANNSITSLSTSFVTSYITLPHVLYLNRHL